MSTRGIFSLGTIETRIREDSWVPMPTVWGGNTRYDGVEKINYNTYFTGGGTQPSAPLAERTTFADRIVLTTDTSSVVPSAQLPFTVGNTDDGFNTPSTTVSWWSGNQRSRVYKLTYATESQSSSPSGTFASGPSGNNEWTMMAAVGNNEVGYFGGGDSGPSTSRVQKITFSEETFANLPATGNMTGPSRIRMATNGTPTRGYFTGGYPSTQNSARMEYSTDTMSQISNSNEGYFSRGSTGTDIAGYFTGGLSSPHNGISGGEAGTEKIVYSSETFVNVPTLYGNYQTGLPSYSGNGSRRAVGGSGSKEHGYWAGGYYPSPSPNDYRSWVDKVDFATETASRRITNIQNARANVMGTGPRKNALATYDPPTPTPTATQTVTPASPQTENIGYAAAGSGSGGGSTVDKMTLSNGTISRIPSTNISSVPGPSSIRIGSVGYGSKTDAFIAGGSSSPSARISNIDKITYATDTVSLNALQITSSPSGEWDGKSSQTKTTGYFFGMGPAVEYTHKHPFATDTLTRFEGWSTPSPMPTSYPGSRTRGSSTFNDLPQTNIYAMGSYNGSHGAYYSARLKPATDTWDNGTPSPAWGRGDYQARRDGANGGAASTTKGYVGGGGYNLSNIPGNLSVFEFSTETWDYLPSGPPNTSYYYFGKGIIGNQTESYWLGGSPGPTWPSFSVSAGDGNYKYTYATDSWSGNWNGGMPGSRSRFATASPRMFQNDIYIPQDNLL